MTDLIPIYILIFAFGIVIGSFLNVCIYRIPQHETVVTERSHCMKCGYQLAWYDMVPVFSWLFLRGRCRKCKAPISPQYPIVEALNGIMYVIIFAVNGLEISSIIYCLLTSALIVLSVIDWRTYEIPFGINIFILVLGILHVFIDHDNWSEYVIGFFCVSVFLEILLLLSGGRAIGGGDVKLMACAGSCNRLAEYNISIFPGMHHRFRDTSDPYENNKSRQHACNGTIFGSRNFYFDAMGRENDIGISGTSGLLKKML